MKDKKTVFTPLERKGIFSLSLILFFRMFGLFLVLPIFSLLSLELDGATPALVGLALGAYGLTQACLQIPFGIWSDRIGRKPVIAFGLCLFIAGSIMGALATSIYWMIVARLIQGSGAISAAIFALIADLTRPEVRTRANAGLGMSIGLSFGVAIFSAPFLGHWFGLSGIFWVISGMAIISFIVLIRLVPDADPVHTAKTQSTFYLIHEVLARSSLRSIMVGAFVCSMGLSVTFFMMPLILQQYGIIKSELWKVYLPMLLLGGLAMVPSAIVAEVKNRFREVMLCGIGLLLSSLIFIKLGYDQGNIALFIGGLFLFFMGFNMFEPIFPSLVTRMTSPETKGTASGLYNFAQFFGHFVGAVTAGVLYKTHFSVLLGVMVAADLFFLYVMWSFPNPERVQENLVYSESVGV